MFNKRLVLVVKANKSFVDNINIETKRLYLKTQAIARIVDVVSLKLKVFIQLVKLISNRIIILF